MKLRVLAFALAILAFFIFVGSPFQQSANAVVIVDDAIIAIIIAGLAAMGITFSMTGGYYTLRDWVATMALEAGVDFTGSRAGVNSVSNLLLNNRLVREITTVVMYIVNKYSLTSNSNVTILSTETGVLDELTNTMYYPSSYTSETIFTEGTVLMSFASEGTPGTSFHSIFRFDGTYYKIEVTYTGRTTVNWAASYSEDLETWTRGDGNTMSNWGNFPINISLYEDNGEVWFYMDSRYGGAAYPHRLWKLLTVSTGDDLIANCGVIDIPSDTEIGDNYGILSLPVPWGESYQEILNSIPTLTVEDELAGNTTLTLDSDSVVEGQIDSTLTNEQYVSADPSSYTVTGLQSVFPFCIPFDLYNFVSCLAADPVAPSFTWRFYVPGICDESIEIDLSEFDTAAQILRTMELLLFCVGLAFVTRKIIRG